MRLLCQSLRGRGFKALPLREPGGTDISESIRDILLDLRHKSMDIMCEMLLYQAARAQIVKEKILPALTEKKIVLLDRFLDATIVYQGYAGGINIPIIKKIGAMVTLGIQPDLTILLDIDAEEGLKKAGRRDRMEKKSLQFHSRVRQGYLELARQKPQRIKVVPVAREIAQTQTAVKEIVEKVIRSNQ
ncbi:MAG: dTMP kinase [Candidatus Omnitrophota bacterium]